MEPGGEKVKVRAANFDFVGEDMMPTMVKPAEETYESRDIGSRPTTECQLAGPPRRGRVTCVDKKGEDTSVEQGRDDERATAERSDVTKDTMSATARSRKRWSGLTPASLPRNA